MTDPLVHAAATWPDAPALSDVTGSWTWRGLLDAAITLARHIDEGLGGPKDPRPRVALLMEDSAATVIGIHAIRLSGATLVPLHRRWTLAELAPLVERVDARLLLHDAAHATSAAALQARRPALAACVFPSALEPTDEPPPRPTGGGGAIVFTSGTTAAPRGVVLSRANLLASAASWDTWLGASAVDHWLATLPLSHVAGLGVVLRSVCSGARLTVHARFDPGQVRHALGAEGVSHVSLVPTQLARLLEHGPVHAPQLRALLLGGGPIPALLVARAIAAGLPVVPTYGLTEAASGVTALPASETAEHPDSAGYPLPGMRVRITGQTGELPHGAVGGIEVSGPSICSGYDDDPAATAAALDAGWLRTGDLGSLDAAGRLRVMDRQDELIISGGENVSPVEVETVLRGHPLVADVAVVGRLDPVWGHVPVAAIEPRPSADGWLPPATEIAASLLDFGRIHLAAFKVPAGVAIVPAVPRTASGKIIRRDVSALMDVTPIHRWVERPDGARIHVTRVGRGPMVLLLHATLSNAHELGHLAHRLATNMTVLAIDRRSAGASVMLPNDLPGPIDVAVHLTDLLAALDAEVAATASPLVVGHSYGACVGLELAARHPHALAGAWLYEPPYLNVLPGNEDTSSLGTRITGIAAAEGLPAAGMAFLETVNGPEVAQRLPATVRAQVEREGRGAVADAALAGMDPDGLARIRTPIIIGLGGRSRGPYATVASRLAERIPNLGIETFPGLGHGAPISRPDDIAAAILAFATRIGYLDPTDPAPGDPS